MVKKILFSYALTCFCISASAEIYVDTSKGILLITSDLSGTVIAKIIGPDDEVVVDESYSGSSFLWTPEGSDGAYRYDVRVVPNEQSDRITQRVEDTPEGIFESDYAGGSIEVKNGLIALGEEKLK